MSNSPNHPMSLISLSYEHRLWSRGLHYVAGVDEAGRGPLAGPVVAAAVVLHRGTSIEGVDDSKVLTPAERDRVYERVLQSAAGVGVGMIGHRAIDEMNILRATMKAMAMAVGKLPVVPEYLLVDGPRYDDAAIPYTAIVDGDALCCSIAAASIIAKVTRDRLMIEYDRLYPEYGFARHKGYGTPEHIEALRRHGPCDIHRLSFHIPGRNHGTHNERSRNAGGMPRG